MAVNVGYGLERVNGALGQAERGHGGARSDDVDADGLCVGEKAPNSRWSGRHFRRPSHRLFEAPEM